MTHALRTSRTTLALAALLGLAATGATAPALAENSADWYQVEMIVFERIGGADGIEQWPRNIQLRYPFNWVTLKDPEADLAAADDSEAPRPSWDNGLAALQEPAPADPARDAFLPLPEDLRSMDRFANAMNRSGQYRVLFHEAWRQPVTELEESPALLIQGGDTFDNHTELEGSITLSVSRYLHLHTRLWFTEFEPNYGQPPGAWPELPRRPDAPQPDTASTADGREAAPLWGDEWQNPTGTAWDTSLNTTSSLPDFLEEDYLPRRIVTLNQQRRMRSEELHYLDHPIVGLMIRVTPYERPDEEETGSDEE
ncbi:CsiV family protein [Marinimicrobium sp. LS-A18]|uniref:CsiV family protein n=1 Tax=Marinimicrobium sp. LS-A18 TaxID=1381596 RepID=UPI000465D40D|nr:CsiV family protein [Marinimicrobium sp. LS-A18]